MTSRRWRVNRRGKPSARRRAPSIETDCARAWAITGASSATSGSSTVAMYAATDASATRRIELPTTRSNRSAASSSPNSLNISAPAVAATTSSVEYEPSRRPRARRTRASCSGVSPERSASSSAVRSSRVASNVSVVTSQRPSSRMASATAFGSTPCPSRNATSSRSVSASTGGHRGGCRPLPSIVPAALAGATCRRALGRVHTCSATTRCSGRW